MPKASVSAKAGYGEATSAGSGTTTQHSARPARVVAREPSRADHQPASGMEASAPTAIPASTTPSPASPTPSRSLTAGTRAAQEPNSTPLSRKIVVTAARARRRAATSMPTTLLNRYSGTPLSRRARRE